MADTPHLNQHVKHRYMTKNYEEKIAREGKLHALCVLIFRVWRVDEISAVEPSHLASLQSNRRVKGVDPLGFIQSRSSVCK